MSRALFLSLSEAEVIAKCDHAKVGISALERLPAGGVRLVCMSSDGAAVMTRKLKSSLIPATTARAPFRPAYSRH
ncbi:hypothetical protein [Sphingomonas sp. LHG3406-1]|uniref:hypothetical protein n=1 Tax=Sphingomonas sp. LHG3406-1 TaxID=2804617 RepID=UPI00261D997A|nr:hypothetical protein [Sphingomonas sp. LHG3406-1]